MTVFGQHGGSLPAVLLVDASAGLAGRPLGKAALAVAGMAEGEVEYFAEHPGLAFQVPFGPCVARHGHAAAPFARIFYPRSAALCHARMVARFASASDESDSVMDMSATAVAVPRDAR